MRRLLTREEALAAWEVLVDVCGARDTPDDREEFARAVVRDRQVEFRFQGRLAFGGKFHFDGESAWVGCYREDATPLREAACEVATSRLRDIVGGREPDRRPAADGVRALVLLDALAGAVEAVAAAEARCREIRLTRAGPGGDRPKAADLRKAEADLRTLTEVAEAAALRSREHLRRARGAAGVG